MIPIGGSWMGKQQEPPKYPYVACLQKSATASLCGRDVGYADFRFVDVPYAMKHYVDGKTLKVCPACADMARMLGLDE